MRPAILNEFVQNEAGMLWSDDMSYWQQEKAMMTMVLDAFGLHSSAPSAPESEDELVPEQEEDPPASEEDKEKSKRKKSKKGKSEPEPEPEQEPEVQPEPEVLPEPVETVG